MPSSRRRSSDDSKYRTSPVSHGKMLRSRRYDPRFNPNLPTSERRYGRVEDWLVNTDETGDYTPKRDWRWLGLKPTSHGGTSITPKDDPEYVKDYRTVIYRVLKDQHDINVTKLPARVKSWIDNKIDEFRSNYRKVDSERDVDPQPWSSPFWKRYDPEEVADNIVEEMDS